MNILEIVRFAIRGLGTNKLRTALTTLGIACLLYTSDAADE